MDNTHAVNVLASAFASELRSQEQRRRRYLETAVEREAKNGVVQGFVDLNGPGEAVITVSFPIMFLQKPLFSAGLELADNQWLTIGRFPLWSACVGAWTTDTAPSGVVRYVGAQLGVVVVGTKTDLRSILHYSFSGRSFTNPANRDPNVGGAL